MAAEEVRVDPARIPALAIHRLAIARRQPLAEAEQVAVDHADAEVAEAAGTRDVQPRQQGPQVARDHVEVDALSAALLRQDAGVVEVELRTQFAFRLGDAPRRHRLALAEEQQLLDGVGPRVQPGPGAEAVRLPVKPQVLLGVFRVEHRQAVYVDAADLHGRTPEHRAIADLLHRAPVVGRERRTCGVGTRRRRDGAGRGRCIQAFTTLFHRGEAALPRGGEATLHRGGEAAGRKQQHEGDEAKRHAGAAGCGHGAREPLAACSGERPCSVNRTGIQAGCFREA